MPQLHQQALLQVAGAHPRRLELLQAVQYCHDFVQLYIQFRAFQQGLVEFLQLLLQAPVVVGGVDDREGDQAVRVRQAGEVELPQQLFLQGLAGGIARLEIGIRHVVGSAHRCRGRGQQIIPLGIHWQFFGQVPIPVAVSGQLVGPVLAVHRAILAGAVGLFPGICLALAGKGVILFGFQQGIAVQGLLYLLLQVQGGQLQQPDSLLQLWRHRQLLAQFELQRLLHEPLVYSCAVVVAVAISVAPARAGRQHSGVIFARQILRGIGREAPVR